MIAKGLVFAVLIIFLSIIKPIAYRPVAQNYKLTFSSLILYAASKESDSGFSVS